MLDIKAIHTIQGKLEEGFNQEVLQVVKDLQSDGLIVEVQYQTSTNYDRYTIHSVMIIGRGK